MSEATGFVVIWCRGIKTKFTMEQSEKISYRLGGDVCKAYMLLTKNSNVRIYVVSYRSINIQRVH